MSKTAMRRHIAEAVLEDTDRGKDERRGALRKHELKAVMQVLGIWNRTGKWSARAWRRRIREFISRESRDDMLPARRFTSGELADLRDAVNDHGIENKQVFTGP